MVRRPHPVAKARWFTAALAAVGLLVSAPLAAVERVLDQLDVNPAEKGNVIAVNLTVPMRMMSFQPEKHGDLIHVQVQPIAAPGVDLCALTERQTLQWSPDDNVPLVEVDYEPNSLQVLDRSGNNPCERGEAVDQRAALTGGFRVLGTAEIAFRFNRPVWFEVPGGANPRVLNLVLLGANAGQVNVDTTREVEGEHETPMLEEPANLPLDVPRTPAPGAAPAPALAATEESTVEQRYIVALLESPDAFDKASIPGLDALTGRRLFSTSFHKNGKTWHRLDVGFFPDEAAARALLAQVRIQFPDAQVMEADDDVRTAAREAALRAVPAPTAGPAPAAPSGDRNAQLVQEARDAILAKDFSAAVRKLEAVTTDVTTPYRKEAQELLGVAHERALRYEQAVVDYRKFIEWYPAGEDTERVRQRLAGLLTATQDKREKLRTSRMEQTGVRPTPPARSKEAPPEQPTEYQLAGGLSQNWRRENQYNTGQGMDPVTSTLQSNLDLNGRMQGSQYRGRARLDTGYAYDFLANTRFKPRTQFSNVYLELGTRDNRELARVGRQSAGSGGVLGRFDGGVVSYAVMPKVKVNLVGGLPVESSSNAPPNADKYFVGVNTDIGQLWGAWDFNVFYIEQHAFDIVDRRAMGGEARYFKDNFSLFSLVDYDVSYDVLNSLLLLGNYMFDNRASVNATIDYRKSPYITTSDAIQGQGVTSLDDLHNLLAIGQVRRLARDRVAQSATMTVGGYYPINDRFSVNADFTTTNTDSTPPSGGVPAIPSTGWEYMYSSQLLINNLFRENDTGIVGFQYAQLANSDNFSAFIGTRHTITPQLRFAPTVRYTHSSKLDGTTDWAIIPEIQLDYHWKRNIQFELEGGVNHSLLGQVNAEQSHFDEYFVLTGYRIDF